MMSRFNPRLMMLVGFLLMVAGFVIPLLMVMQIVNASFILSILSYAASLVGLVLGLLGVVFFAARSRHK